MSKSLCIAAQEERLVAEMSLKGPDLVKRMALTTLDSVFVSYADYLVPRCLSPAINAPESFRCRN